MSNMELLSPAGSMDALYAAFRNGADAVYLGGQMFNARRNAANFDEKALSEACAFAHERGKKIYVTVNIMIKQSEMGELVAFIKQLHAADIDGIIVTDLGAAQLIHTIAPDIHLHASTQMAVHNAAGVRYLKRLGFDRVVLAREMTLAEIRECVKEGVELEVFGHGALCSATSGQCLFSSLIGGRSGNRGMCAQPCRMRYKLTGKGFEKDGYMLSTKDLNTLELINELNDAGVVSLKLEGRMKRPEYVAVTTRIYRKALDGKEITEEDERELRQMFNRGGFTKGYMKGVADGDLTYTLRPNHIGVCVGRTERGKMSLTDAVDDKDVLVLRNSESEEDVPIKASALHGTRMRDGSRLIRLVSEKQMKTAAASFENEVPAVRLTGRLVLRMGEKAVFEISDGVNTAKAFGDIVDKAERAPIDREKAEKQLAKTGNTPYCFENIEYEISDDAFAAASQLNALRRDAISALSEQRTAKGRTGRLCPDTEINPVHSSSGKTMLGVQSMDISLLKRAKTIGADELLFAPANVKKAYLDGLSLDTDICLVLPAVLDDDSLTALNEWALANAEHIVATYISNISQFELKWPGELRTDHQMNVANVRTAGVLEKWGVKRYTASNELNMQEIKAVGGCRELIVFGRLTMMYLRHCPVNAALGGSKHAMCARCDRDSKNLTGAELTDRTGAKFPLVRLAKENGCVVRILNSVPLMPLRKFNDVSGFQACRMIFEETENPIADDAIAVYRAMLDGKDYRSMPEWQTLESMETTNGHLFRGVE